MIPTSSFEITTQIGCSVQCKKYCPQELIVSRYKGERHLSLETFKKFISTVPTDVNIHFAGFCEPFLNPECPDMILWAHEKGHKIVIASTLVGLKSGDADRIMGIPFDRFILHLPDIYGNARIPITPEYLDVLGKILSNVSNISYMNMGADFVSNNRENVARGCATKRHTGRISCHLLNRASTNYQIVPNGDVFLCCMTATLSGRIGSIYKNTYEELKDPKQFSEMVLKLETDPESICHMCSWSYPRWHNGIKKVVFRLLGDKKAIIKLVQKYIPGGI
jgi:hypothetical protein